jgi:hypothetical protein
MADHEREPREHRIRRAVAQHDREEAELAHGAEREDALEVGLAQRLHAAEQHREHTQCDRDRTPRPGEGEHGCEPRDEVDARLHHGRGMQVGAHRGGRRHGAGQPEVEREDRGLAERSDQQQHDRGVDQRTGRREVQDPRHARGAGLDGEEHHADEHREAPERGHQQRLQRRSTARAAAVIMPDQQVGKDAGQLPEHDQQHEVVGGHQAVHRAGEGQQHRRELPDALLGPAEVPPAVEQHERAHPGDDEGEQPAQLVEPEGERQAELRDPVDRLPWDEGGIRGSGQHLRREHHQMHEGGGGHERGDGERACADPGDQQRQQQRREGEHGEECQHGGLLWLVGLCGLSA